jgi:signal transduction histidine kinase
MGRWKAFAPLAVAFSFWVTSSLMPGLAQQNVETRLFRAFSQLGSAALAVGNLSTAGLSWAGHLFGVLAAVLAPVILHFHFTLPGARLERLRRLVLSIVYAIGAVILLPYLVLGAVSYWWWAGWGHVWLRLVLFSALLCSLIWLGYNYVIKRSPDTRRQLRFVILGTGWGFIPILLLSLLPDTLGLSFIPYPFTMLFLALIPTVYWYAIMRFDLLRVDLVLNRSLVYLSTALALGGAYVLVVRLAKRFLPGVALPPELTGALLLVMASGVTVPLHGLIQHGVDRVFYGGWYDYRSVISDISRSMAGTLDRRVLEELLLERVAGTLWVRGAALLLPEAHSGARLAGRQVGTLGPSLVSLEMGGPLTRHLCEASRPVETPWLQQRVDRDSLGPSEDALLNSGAIRWWIPIASGDRLSGLLLLGARLGGEGFSADDLQILDTLSDQAALAIENILLVEKLQLQLEQIENSRQILAKMHQRLLIGREDERKHLARELHDSPVQKLIALRYQLGECIAQLDDANLRRALDESRDEAGSLVNELRGLCRDLRPPLLDAFGLATAIQAHGEEVGERHGLKIQLALEDDEGWQIPEDVSVSLFRICQEVLSNVIRHADADLVAIRLYRKGPMVTLEIQDDGVGFTMSDSMDHLAAEGHFGLLGIRERIELLKGRFEIESRPGEGTKLCVQVPVQPV